MSIEACSFLRPSLKAKLQDSGILFLNELLHFFNHVGAEQSTAERTEENNAAPFENRERAPEAASSVFAADADAEAHVHSSDGRKQVQHLSTAADVLVLKCDDSLVHSLKGRLPKLATDELYDLIGSMTGYLSSIAKQTSARGGSGRDQRAGESAHSLTCEPQEQRGGQDQTCAPQRLATSAPVTAPFFTIRSLGQIEDEANAPNRAKPLNRRGPTHATTFCRSIDTLLGAPDRVVPANRDASPVSVPSPAAEHVKRAVQEGGKGVEVGKVTEFSGPPGVGKTQMLLQLAVSCAMPVELGGLAGDCLFVDTEGSFVYERFHELALAAVSLIQDLERRHRSKVAKQNGGGGRDVSDRHNATPFSERADVGGEVGRRKSPASQTSPTSTLQEPKAVKTAKKSPTPLAHLVDKFTLSSILSRVHYVRVTDTASFMAVLYSIPGWIAWMGGHGATSPSFSREQGETMTASQTADFSLKMLLVDSIAGPFRTVMNGLSAAAGASSSATSNGANGGADSAAAQELSSLRQRNRLLFCVGERLQAFAASFNLAVVVSNQVTSRVTTRHRPSANMNDGNGFRTQRRRRHDNGGRTESDSDDNVAVADEQVPLPSNPNANLRQQAEQFGGEHLNSGGSNDRSAVGRETADNSGDAYTYLVPALGDVWASHAATRVLLSYHHYALPYFMVNERDDGDGCEGEGKSNSPALPSSTTPAVAAGESRRRMLNRTMCPEDVVIRYRNQHTSQLQQHRVARLIKHDCNQRGECCFTISRKGIRDAAAH